MANAPAPPPASKPSAASLVDTREPSIDTSGLRTVVEQANQLQEMIAQLQRELGSGPVSVPGAVSYVVQTVPSGGTSASSVAALKAWQAQLSSEQARLAAESSDLTAEHNTLVTDAAELEAEQRQIDAEQTRLTQTSSGGVTTPSTTPATTLPPVTTPTVPPTTVPTTNTTTGASGGHKGDD